MTRAQREQHLRRLAAEIGVDLELDPRADSVLGVHGTADSATGTATVYGWDGDNASYLVGLHELGHFACGHMPRNDKQREQVYWFRLVEAEAEAWLWALTHSLERAYVETLRLIRDNWLGSYTRDYGLDTAGVAYSSVASRVGLKAAA